MSDHMVTIPSLNLDRELERPASRADPIAAYARIRAMGPVLRSRSMFGESFAITRYEDVASVLRDPRAVSDRRSLGDGGRGPMDRWWMPGPVKLILNSMVMKDPPDHRRLRKLVQMAFTPSMVAGLTARVETITSELLDEMARQGRADRRPRAATAAHGDRRDARCLARGPRILSNAVFQVGRP